ncbi:MAG: hypothetical protein COA84_02035 [Robiginitomaculum sp.]|nr:MAG: hypothetical protein COA84_02035 [Robiginitomaculum sp.]
MAAFFTILALTFGLIAPSQADDVELSVGGWVTKGNSNATITAPGRNKAIELTADSVSTTSLKDTVTTNYGDTISIRNQAGNGLTYILELTPQQSDQGAIFVAITLKSIDGKIEKTLPTPSLLIVDKKMHRSR